MDVEIVMNKLENLFVGETHEAFESYKFHLRKQEPSENIETYMAALSQLAKNCNFGQLRDRLIRDQVVVGVRDDCVREKLPSDKQLTLDKCLQIGRPHKTSKQQTKTISSCTDTDVQIKRVNKNLNKRYPNQNQNKMENRCIRCFITETTAQQLIYAANSVQKLNIIRVFAGTSLKLGNKKMAIFWFLLY